MRLGKPSAYSAHANLTAGEGGGETVQGAQSLAHPRSSKLVQEASPAPGRTDQPPGPPLSSVRGWAESGLGQKVEQYLRVPCLPCCRIVMATSPLRETLAVHPRLPPGATACALLVLPEIGSLSLKRRSRGDEKESQLSPASPALLTSGDRV